MLKAFLSRKNFGKMKKRSPPSPPSSSVSRKAGPSHSIGKRRRGSSSSLGTRKNPRPLPPPVVHAPAPPPPLMVDVVCSFCKRERAIWAPNCCKIRTYCGQCKTGVRNFGTGCPSCNSPLNPTWEMAAWAPEAGGEADAPAPLQ